MDFTTRETISTAHFNSTTVHNSSGFSVLPSAIHSLLEQIGSEEVLVVLPQLDLLLSRLSRASMVDIFNDETEQMVSIQDFLQNAKDEELEADLVLGGDEGKECTYNNGYMKRSRGTSGNDCICENWFHENHLGLKSSDEIPRDEDGEPIYEDFICQACAKICSFLTLYPPIIWAIVRQCDATQNSNKEGTMSAGAHSACASSLKLENGTTSFDPLEMDTAN
ncbi:hypothetical protein IFM89_025205 [Coptis chinensis]|uniref:Uncharacterized protein n=1 Tax=Coptis chinensis TaxID=261450 RepID=A0A835MJ68_9MAGN|nr:hypothetical protein IFM89_025205 [Coptis chinensis]